MPPKSSTPKQKRVAVKTVLSSKTNRIVKAKPNQSILNFFTKTNPFQPIFFDDDNEGAAQESAGSANGRKRPREDDELGEDIVITPKKMVDEKELFGEDLDEDMDKEEDGKKLPPPPALPFEEVSDEEEDTDLKEISIPLLPTPAIIPPSIPTRSPDGEFDADTLEAFFEDADDGIDIDSEDVDERSFDTDNEVQDEKGLSCPICGRSLATLGDQEANAHVNACLDVSVKVHAPNSTTPAPIAPIGPPPTNDSFDPQASLVSVKSEGTATASAHSVFSKIMTANAETHAWRTAQAAEEAEYGKPAAERKCPFYKKMFAGQITMDAFRYSAVPGCNAYFLSHFHSDHYIGLSSSWTHGKIYCSTVTAKLVVLKLKVKEEFVVGLPWETDVEVPETGGIKVRLIAANHCPGSAIFLFTDKNGKRILHCGDFRASSDMVRHPELKKSKINEVYLDTTYLNPKYAFPPQKEVIEACAQLCVSLSKGESSSASHNPFSLSKAGAAATSKTKLLVVIGTYNIGKERICVGIAKALKTKIFALKSKRVMCECLEDPELSELLTDDPVEGQVHMTGLREISIETLKGYLKDFKGKYDRIVGFKPTGWNYRPPASRTDSPTVESILNAPNWRSHIKMTDLSPGKGSTKDVSFYMVPYSEHSSFRELTCFCCSLDIGKVIPTVNIGSEKSRAKMNSWLEKWEKEKKKNGLYKLKDGEEF